MTISMISSQVHEFLIEVTITDNNKLRPDALSSVVYIPVKLNDINEDDPTFVKPSTPASFTITIAESMPRGAVCKLFTLQLSSQSYFSIPPPRVEHEYDYQ